ncbi:hypothetical protein HK105_207181 [Polyrhizophydium stewartii]|uniref:Uncharacterized protein n=1 Tax=Polyrhizophydium stewartii TaxID=2732419 RepID=A0ABR4N1B3_9FUNG|nr:hypothetical protein HK105_004109 [Polyrhizophydium stewartii]
MLTAGEECQQAAKILSSFADPRQGAITGAFITSAMGLAVFRGDQGVAVVRLHTGEWSAPCAITWENAQGTIQPGQETVLLFMSESSIFALVGRTPLVLGQTHRFMPGPLYGNHLNLDTSVDVYAYVRYNNGFTPADLISAHMTGWSVREDAQRHSRWHGHNATWFDVLTNKITVDRSSVGNALYLVLNMAANNSASGVKTLSIVRKNHADLSKLAAPQQQQQQPVQSYAPTQPVQQPGQQPGQQPVQQQQPLQQQADFGQSLNLSGSLAGQQTSSLQAAMSPEAQALYQQMLLQQQQQQLALLQHQQQQQQQLLMQSQTVAIPPHAQQMYGMQSSLQAQAPALQPQASLGMGYGQLPTQPLAMPAASAGLGVMPLSGAGLGLQQQQQLQQMQLQQLQQMHQQGQQPLAASQTQFNSFGGATGGPAWQGGYGM